MASETATTEPAATETATQEPAASATATPSPVATGTATLEPTASATLTLTPTPVISATPTLTETLADGIVTPGEGGELRSADGRVRVIFPAGAVTQTVRIEHRPRRAERVGAGQTGRAIEFELNARTNDRAARSVHRFAKPLELRVDVEGLIDLDALRYWQYPYLAYLDEQTERWVELPTQREGNVLVTQLDHFSILGSGAGSVVNSGWLLTFNDAQVSTFSGAFTYDYPIKVPEGRGGLTPDLSLNYNSRRIDGLLTWVQADWVGLGWTLDTMEIVRKVIPDWSESNGCPKWWSEWFHYENEFTLLYKGTGYKLKPAMSDPDRRFGRYHTEDEQFLYIERRNAAGGNGSDHNQTSEYWVVRLRDGTTYRLGYNSDSEQILHNQTSRSGPYRYAGDEFPELAYRWRVDQIYDRQGNRIEFSYKESELRQDPCGGYRERYSLLEEIRYNFLPDGKAGTLITFTRALRNSDSVNDWIGQPTNCWICQPFYQDHFLRSIRIDNWVASQYQTLREYYLTYVADPANGKVRLLQSITEYGRGGMAGEGGHVYSLPATTFGYTPKPNKGTACDPCDEWHSSSFAYGRLSSINNGYGGCISVGYDGFLYQEIWDWNHKAWNYHVSSKTVTGQPGGYQISYTYPQAMQDRCYDDDGNGQCDNPLGADGTDQNTGGTLVGYKWVTETLQTLGGQAIAKTGHQYRLYPYPSTFLDHARGRELETVYQDSSGTPLKRVTTDWEVDDLGGLDPQNHHYFVHPTWVKEYTREGSGFPAVAQKRTQYGYDIAAQHGGKQYGNLTDVWEYQGETLLRHRATTYYVKDDAAALLYIIDRPATEEIKDGAGRLVASTRYYYDGAARYDTPPASRGDVSRVDQLKDADTGEYITTQTTAYTTTQINLNQEVITLYLPWRITDGNGNVTETIYDSAWLHPAAVRKVVSPTLTLATTYEYTPTLGLVSKVTDPNGAATRYDYDPFGRLQKVAQPGDSLSAPTLYYDYDDGSPLLITTSAAYTDTAGVRQTLPTLRFYDGLGRLIREAHATTDRSMMDVTDTTYNAQGLPQEVYAPYRTAYTTAYATPVPSRPKTSIQYDTLGRVKLVTQPGGATVSTDYDGFKRTVTDENGHRKVYTSDPFGRLTSVEEYTGTVSGPTLYATTRYIYDVRDVLTGTIDTNGNRTEMTYDALGRKISMTDPDMGTWTYDYDNAGNLKRQTDARNQGICFSYDALNRLTGKQYITGTECSLPLQPDIIYRYDEGPNGLGRRTSMTDPSGSTAWSYDARGRVTAETKRITGASSIFTTTYSYRSDDQVLSQANPDGELLNFTYDVWGRPWGMDGAPASEGEVTHYVSSATYTVTGQLAGLTYGNGVATTYTYDPVTQRLTGISAPGASLSLSYGYDKKGNVKAITDTVQTVIFTYDPLDRLTAATGAYAAKYDYDPLGNLLKKTEGSTTHTLTYPSGSRPARPHTPLTVDGQTYSYDANGNLTGRPGQTLTYDHENRLLRVVSGAQTTEYTYDGDGRLVKKVAPEGTTLYVSPYFEVTTAITPPDPLPTPTPNPALTHKVILPFVLSGGAYEVDGQRGAAVHYYLFNGKRVAMREGDNGDVVYLYHDHLGSTVATSDGKSTRYWPYGAARSGVVDTPYRYTGQRIDTSTGLYYYQSRYFDPSLGRFAQPDTIVPEPGNPQALNRYSYGKNSPQRYVDPDGHNPLEILKWSFYGLAFTAGYNAEAGRQVRSYAEQYGFDAEQLWVMYRYAGTPAEEVGIDHEVCLDAGFNTANSLVAAPLAAVGMGLSAMDGARQVTSWLANSESGALKIGAEKAMTVPASQIRFTQRNISWATKEQPQIGLDTLTDEIANGYFRGSVRVVERNGKLYSLDNRRLAAFKLLDIDVPVTRVSMSDPEIAALWRSHFSTLNDGTSIVVRGTNIIIK